jgi:hypothetical protein
MVELVNPSLKAGSSGVAGESGARGRVNASRPRGKDVPEDLLATARAHNRYDLELYRYAQDAFDAIPERGELEFEIELAALRAAQSDGVPDPATPPPRGFSGSQGDWQLLLDSRARELWLQWEIAQLETRLEEQRSEIRPAQAEKLGRKSQKLSNARVRNQQLEEELQRLRDATAGSTLAAGGDSTSETDERSVRRP